MNNSIEPKVAIILLNYNTYDHSKECIDSLLKLNYSNFTIFVVDNGSVPNKSSELVKYFGDKIKLKYITPNIGYAKGINVGLEYASSIEPDYFLIINNDSIIDKNALKYLIETSEKYDDNAISSGKTYHYNDPNRFQYIGGIWPKKGKFYNPCINEIDVGQAEEEREMAMLDDMFWVIPMKIYKTIGGYCPYYFLYGEQSDYAEKAKRKGFKLIYTPKAKLWHKGEVSSGNNMKGSPAVAFWRSKSGMMFIYRNRSKWFFLKYFTTTLLKTAIKIPLFFLTDKGFSFHLARFVGIMSFLKWVINPKIDYGSNPFLK